MKLSRILSLVLILCLLLTITMSTALAGKRVKSIPEVLAKRDVVAEPQTRALRLGEDGRPRMIITSDLEIDDMNSFIHQCLFFNDVDLAGIVVSGSFCHFTGDGEHMQKEVMDHIQNREEGALEMTSFRPQPLDWLPNLWMNEYAEAFEYLSQNAEGYPTPERLCEITKIGNVQFEGDTRFDTEGSDLIKACLLDDDDRNLFIVTWGGFNTVARAPLSTHEEYGDTDLWQAVYEKVTDKAIIMGNSQDWTYEDFIKPLYPDLVIMVPNCGYPGYSAALNVQEDCRYTFQADWLKANIKFDHGALMGCYKTVNDGQHIDGEEDKYQFGETNIVYDKEYNDFDYIAEGDSTHFIGLIAGTGLRGLENGAFDSYAGRASFVKASGEDAGYLCTLPGGVLPGLYVNPVTNNIEKFNPYLLDFQLEWAARADWCVKPYAECNHAPAVEMAERDFTAAPGETVSFAATLTDPDGDDITAAWTVDPTGGVYHSEDMSLFDWTADTAGAEFTVPADAQPGDSFLLTLRARDVADAPMTRYAQVQIIVE